MLFIKEIILAIIFNQFVLGLKKKRTSAVPFGLGTSKILISNFQSY